MKRILIFIFTFLFLCLHLFVKTSYSTEGKLTQLTINGNQVEVTIKAENCFNYDFEEIILDGIPVKLIFDIKLYRQSRCWFDQAISSLKINHVIKYDNLKDFASDVANHPIEFEPGSDYLYGINMAILGRVVEVVTTKSFYEFLKNPHIRIIFFNLCRSV